MKSVTIAFIVMLATSSAFADIKTEEAEFGEHGYKSMRAIHEQTCSCKEDGNCRLKVTRAELKEQLERYTETSKTLVPRAWPELTKKFASMTTADARAYGERLGKDYLDTLPRKSVLLWMRMLASCWGTSTEPSNADSEQPAKDTPHDGSLSKRGEVMDMRNGKIDEASGIAVFVQGCRKTVEDKAKAGPLCSCFADYLRLSPPSVINTFRAASESGDVSELKQLPGLSKCAQWLTDGAEGRGPFVRKGMKSSTDVEAAFTRCRTKMTKGQPTPSGIVFCNRFVATSN